MTELFVPLAERAEFPDHVSVSSESIFLQEDSRLRDALGRAGYDESRVREMADEVIAVMGLGHCLRPRKQHPDDVIMKPHDFVACRTPAAPEQFFHADAARDGFTGILFLGIEGNTAEAVPPTHIVRNAPLIEHIANLAKNTTLQEKLDEIWVVRPYLDPSDSDRRSNYARHVLARLAQEPFRGLLSPGQLQQADEDSALVPEEERGAHNGDVRVNKLIDSSVVDGEPIVTCGVGSTEIRLAFEGTQSEEETRALTSLHDGITYHLLGDSVEYEPRHVTAGSGLFIPLNQLHRATPYDVARHRRGIVTIKVCPLPGHPRPANIWRREQSTKF